MFVRVMKNGRFLGRAGLEQHAQSILTDYGNPPFFRIGTHLGETGMRSDVWYANDVRAAFRRLRQFAVDENLVLQVFVNAKDSNALGKGGLVWRYGRST
jgi:hypothetical protein